MTVFSKGKIQHHDQTTKNTMKQSELWMQCKLTWLAMFNLKCCDLLLTAVLPVYYSMLLAGSVCSKYHRFNQRLQNVSYS